MVVHIDHIDLDQVWVSSSLGQGQGHFGKIGYFDCQTPSSFAVIKIWYYYGHQGQSSQSQGKL